MYQTKGSKENWETSLSSLLSEVQWAICERITPALVAASQSTMINRISTATGMKTTMSSHHILLVLHRWVRRMSVDPTAMVCNTVVGTWRRGRACVRNMSDWKDDHIRLTFPCQNMLRCLNGGHTDHVFGLFSLNSDPSGISMHSEEKTVSWDLQEFSRAPKVFSVVKS